MKHEKSCGAICYIYEDEEPLILVIQHRYGGHWAFPKGHVEQGETEEQTAIREVREETGARITIIPGYREVTAYSPAKGVMKDVVLFTAQITGGMLHPQPEEVRTVKMMPFEQAKRRLTYPADRELLEKAKNIIFSEKSVDKHNVV